MPSTSSASGPVVSVQIVGKVHGGQQPVAGATIQLYTVGTSGDGSTSTALLTQPVVSASDGTFNITSLYSCSSATLVYLTATGGYTGIGSNSDLALMTALGPCSSLTSATYISVNEVTTVAAVNALAPFMTSLTAIGSSSTDVSALIAAFATSEELADSQSGASPGNNIPNGTTIPTTLINTLADIESSCINSLGGTPTSLTTCGQFFLFTTPGNAASPTNTVAALLNLAKNPTLNPALLFGLAPSVGPFQPSLSTAPSDFRIRPVPNTPASLQITPSELTFPIGSIGVASTAENVTIQNISSSSINLTGLTITGNNAADYSLTNNCPSSLPATSSCTIPIVFTPSATGPRIAYFSVASNTTASPQFVTLDVDNAVPAISSFSPTSLQAQSVPYFSIAIIGSNFIPASTVQVNGSPRQAIYAAPTELIIFPTTSDLAAPGNLSITVTNPAPGGGTTAVSNFPITTPVTPAISRVTPTSFTAGSASTYITVYGTNLATGTIVQWNGTNLTTSSLYNPTYGYYLEGIVPATLLATAGTPSITVYNAVTSPTESNSVSVSIINPPPPTVALSNSLVPINTATTLTLTGSGFSTNSTVAVNGVTVPSTYLYASEMTANLSAANVSTLGINSLTVTSPWGTSTPVYFTVYVPIFSNTMIYNPVNGLFYLSIPSAAGAPYGNSVVSVDPATGALGTPIPVGSEPDRMALTSDGKYLWVALDGANAVRKVDLTANTAGLQFSIGGEFVVASALAAVPGETNSVIVSTYYTGYTEPTGVSMAIYDSGVARPNAITFGTYAPFPYALIVNGTTSEIYGPGDVLNGTSNQYITYTYNASGIAVNASTSSPLNFGANNTDDVTIANGTLYTSFGQGSNPETGALLGTFYSSGTTVAQGSIAVDTTLGKAFILEGSANAFAINGESSTAALTLQAFNLSNYSATSASPITIYTPLERASYQDQGPTGARLTRWGANGLAFHGTGGFVSFHTSMVQDLSAVDADLAVTLTASGTNTTGNPTTYTATITNNGPSNASTVTFNAFLPSSGILTTITPSTGTCSSTGSVSCDIGSLANGASATVVFNVLQTTTGSVTTTVQVTAPETDLVPTNNQASSTITIAGAAYNLAPALSAISPAAIASGSTNTIITLTGIGFSSSSTVLLNGSPLSTSFTSSTQLTAVVPAANLASLGWFPISVTTPAPGGGTSTALPLSVFSALNLGANHIITDPYSRNIMASIGTGTSTIAANSILAINPATASTGSPVTLSGAPTNLALSSDGEVLYTIIPGASSGAVAHFNMLTQQLDFTATGLTATGYNVGLRDIAVQPGADNTVAVDEGEYNGFALYDFNTANKTATQRGNATGIYTGTCLAFPNASTLLATDLYSSGAYLEFYPVTATGLGNSSYPYFNGVVLTDMDCYKIDGNFLYGQAGGVANLSVTPAQQLGIFEGMPYVTIYGAGIKDFAPDSSLGLSFFLTDTNPNEYSSIFDSLTAFNNSTFMPTEVVPLPFTAIEGASGFTGVDMVRWGQDGLGILTSSGRLYLLRGGAVVPQLLNTNTPAVLASSSITSATHGAGNTSLILTGSNFVPGVAVLWNGSYRTTTITDTTHLTVAIPASDLAQAGTANITIVNPGATASTPLIFTIN